jgi:sugar phosphate isomerase/epimerase
MKGNIREYARVGLVHHMLYQKEIFTPKEHLRTFSEMLDRDDIETVDCCLPYDEEDRKLFRAEIARCNKEVVYAMHLIPAKKLSPSSMDPLEQPIVRLVMDDQVKAAGMIGSTGFIFVSGPDTPENREGPRLAFMDFCRWFCGRLAGYGIWGLLEPFDRTIDKKYLYGPVDECIELIKRLRPEVNNLAIELDIAHLPLMGEKIDEAIFKAGKDIRRVHIGNCVLKDKNNKFYGDKHPPIGIEGGEIDVEQTALALSSLYSTGYLDKNNRGALLMEMQPYPGMTVEETIRYSFDKLNKAWEIA